MKKYLVSSPFLFSLLLCVPVAGQVAQAAPKAQKNAAQNNPTIAPVPAPADGEAVEVDAIKKKYWAGGDETRLEVVQDRYYSKAGKLELGVFGAIYSADPFFDTKSAGGSIGYHFTEYFSLKAIGWKDFVSNSGALEKFVQTVGYTVNANPTHYFYGAEASVSPLYGKLSLLGQMIIYFDLHFSGGVGMTETDNGTYPTPFLGVGQKIFVSRSAAISIDARWLTYKEEIIERVRPATKGQKIDEQQVYNNSIAVGLQFFI